MHAPGVFQQLLSPRQMMLRRASTAFASRSYLMGNSASSAMQSPASVRACTYRQTHCMC